MFDLYKNIFKPMNRDAIFYRCQSFPSPSPYSPSPKGDAMGK